MYKLIQIQLHSYTEKNKLNLLNYFASFCTHIFIVKFKYGIK